MPFALNYEFEDGLIWWVGNYASWGPEISIPVDAVGDLSDEEIGKRFRSLVRRARILDMVSYGGMIEQCNIEFLKETVILLSVAINEPEYQHKDVYDVLSWARTEIIRKEKEERKEQEREIKRKNKLKRDEQRLTQPDPGFVYLIKSPTGEHKIGRTNNLRQRLNTFNVKMPFDVEVIHVIPSNHYKVAEKQLHQQFAEKRIRGSEWFMLDNNDIAQIKAIQSL